MKATTLGTHEYFLIESALMNRKNRAASVESISPAPYYKQTTRPSSTTPLTILLISTFHALSLHRS